MQRDIKAIEEAGLHVVGISYDSVAILKAFSDKNHISFPMLSDPGSKTIEDYHLRNTSAKGKAVGVPHPGTFVIDSKGVIREKLFLENFRERHSTEALIKAAKAID